MLINEAEWWLNYGESAPHLKKIAIRILSQTTSSSSCERNWSSFALVHTKQRNRMSQKKLERNVFIHYNVRLRLRNMKRARNQGEQPDYCPINLDYIFAEDDPLLPWLETREQEIETTNSEEQINQGPTTTGTTLQQRRQKTVIEVQEDSSATDTDIGDDDDDDDDHGGSGGHGTGGGGEWTGGGGNFNLLDDADTGFSDRYFVPSTIPYPHESTSQSQRTIDDRGKSPIIQQEDEEEEAEDNEEEEEEPGRMDSNLCAQQLFYPYYPQEPSQGHQFGMEYESYVFGTGYSQHVTPDLECSEYTGNNTHDDNNVQEPPRHSFWW